MDGDLAVAEFERGVDDVLPPLPLRQWVLSVPKRLRYFLHDEAMLQGAVVRTLLRACVRRGLLAQSDGDAMGGWDHGGGRRYFKQGG